MPIQRQQAQIIIAFSYPRTYPRSNVIKIIHYHEEEMKNENLKIYSS
jgi:hypothetical protein